MLQTLTKTPSKQDWDKASHVLSVYAGMDASHWQLSLIDSLDDLDFQNQITKLAQDAIVPNPFFEVPFLKVSTKKLLPKRLQYLCLTKIHGEEKTLKFFAPVTLCKIGIFRRKVLKSWTTPYSPLGMPLVSDNENQETLKALVECLLEAQHDSAKAIVFDFLAKEGDFIKGLYHSQLLSERLLLSVGIKRAGLKPLKNLDYIGTHFSGKRKQRLKKAMSELEALGSITFKHFNEKHTIENAFHEFLLLEDKGWKGKRNTSLKSTSQTIEFAKGVALNAADNNKCHIHAMHLNGKTIASLVAYDVNGYCFPWKITYDEDFAKYSVGNLLATQATADFANSENFKGLDSLAAENNQTTQRFWPDEKEFFTMTIGIGEDATATALEITDELNRLKRIKVTLKRYIKKDSYLERLVASLRM
jgi:hypothetical protein